ncbi:hypothetical protein [Chitinophaga sp.]|uniref:hypothetical protein n=1 Tax=Chitinophaga sp. TaxID=1869181 RepID=UPI0031D6B253
MPKTHYHSSGKIALTPLIIATILAFSACIWCSMRYGNHTASETSLAAQIFALTIWTGVLFFIFFLFRRYNHCRNVRVNVGLGILFSLSSWITNWVFYQDMEMKGFHLVELVMVALPLSVLLVVNYYCENCRQYYSKTTIYILEAGKFYKKFRPGKNYHFLLEMLLDLDHLPEKGPEQPKEIIKIDFHYCDACENRPVVDIDSYTWTQAPKHNRYIEESRMRRYSHGDSRVSREKSIERGVYLDAETGSKLRQYLVG